ncbi:MAG: hypothetical protein ABI232_05380 [Jatrophihabitantaceae bacterium]
MNREARSLVTIVLALSVLGITFGFIWQWWSPNGPAGYVLGPGLVQPGETETFAATDGRFAVLMLGCGVLAALVVWFGRVARGPGAVLALAVGGLAAALLAGWIGGLVRAGGHYYPCGDGTARCIDHLGLSVRMHGLYFLQAAAAVLVYAICVAFAAADDLGRPDPIRDQVRHQLSGSVRSDVQLQYVGGDGDGVGSPQQSQFPPQEHG